MISVLYAKPKKLAGMQSIYVSFPYKAKIVEAIRMIPERFWDGKNKVWELDYKALSELKTLLPKEEFSICGKPIDDSKYGEKKIEKHFTLPKEIKTKLYDFQYKTFNEAMNFDKYLMLLQPGLGKSLCSVAVALKRRELGQIKRCLIVCAVNTIKWNFASEIEKHTGMGSIVLGARQNKKGIWKSGSTQDKLADLETLDGFFIITNIESLRSKEIKEKLKKLIDKGEIGMIIVDECHRLRNPSSQQGKAMLLLAKHIKYFLGLTGTLLVNSPLDAYVPLKCSEGEIANFTQFKSRYCVYGGFSNFSIIGYKHLDELQRKIDKVSIRLLKEDVLDLPPKVYIEEQLEMGKEQSKLYTEVLSNIIENIDNVTLSLDPLGQLIRLRQVTAHTSILSNKINESVKLDRLKEILEDLVGNGEKAVIFSNWTTVTDILFKELRQYNPALITGKVVDREGQKNKFMEDDSCKIIICTIEAAGVGLTLTKANTAIFFDEPWSEATFEQCADRIHRIGTNGSVNIISLLCKNTIDMRVHSIIKRKGALSKGIVDKKLNLKDPSVIRYLVTGEGELDIVR